METENTNEEKCYCSDISMPHYHSDGRIVVRGNKKDLVYHGDDGKTLDEIFTPPPEEKIEIVVSGRIDYCSACKKEHGYNCPKDNESISRRESYISYFVAFVEDEARRIYEESKGAVRRDGGRVMACTIFFDKFFQRLVKEHIDNLNGRTCLKCEGKGYVTDILRTCQDCHGSGYIIKKFN